MGDNSFEQALDLSTGESEVRATLNTGGFQFGGSPLLAEWLARSAALGHKYPMLDVGCAFGANALAAARAGNGDAKVRALGVAISSCVETFLTLLPPYMPYAKVVALDCDERHLAEVREAAEAQNLAGVVSTAYGRLPGNLPEGRFSSILVSEVVHFLSGRQIEQSVAALAARLMPGGAMMFTCASPTAPFAVAKGASGGTEAGLRFQEAHAEGLANGAAWPGELAFDVRSAVFAWQRELGVDEATANAVSLRQPTEMHLVSPELLAAAIERVQGMRVVSAVTARHERYPVRGTPSDEERLSENTQVIAVRDE